MKDEQMVEDIKAVLDYLWKDEERHYAEGRSRTHIFITLRRLAEKVGYKYASGV